MMESFFVLLAFTVGAPRVAEAPSRRAVVPIAIERRLAERLRLRVGDTVALGSDPMALDDAAVVVAIYEPAADPSAITRREYHLRLHLPDLAALLGAPDRVDRFGVALGPGRDPGEAVEALNQLAFGFRAYRSAEIANESSQTFRVVSRFHDAIAVISVVASAIFLLCIMLLKVEERRRDAAVMRFTGISRRTVFTALLLEAVLVAALGSVMGVALALGASAVTNLYYQHFFDTTLVFSAVTPAIIRFSVLLSLGLGLAAGSIAARRLVRTNPMILWGRG
ncbi:MAG TPA: ABC transporter permease [Gemmatimonadales bacterium]|jgi:predicted lysophospholipase L1 biosynthesis ABC-type transport system permease subunit